MRPTLLITGCLLLPLMATAEQAKTDFSGTWLAIPRNTESGIPGIGSGAFICGAQCTIVQTDRTITIKRPSNRQGVALPDVVLKLDGSPSKVTQLGRGGASQDFDAIAQWNDAGQLIVVRKVLSDGQTFTITQSVSIQAGQLIIATDHGRKGIAPDVREYKKG